ncbi:MAG: hypothetical protein ACX94B_12985 [Henriciella sp.]
MKRNKFNRVEIVDLETGKTIQYSGAGAREILRKQSKEESPRYVLKDEHDRAASKRHLEEVATSASEEAYAKARREAAANAAVASHDPEKLQKVKEAVALILADAKEGDPRLTKSGEVQVTAIAELTGFEVNAALRNAAIEELSKDSA